MARNGKYKNMIIFIYGEENYLSYKKLLDIKNQYLKKVGDTNLIEIDANEFDFKKFTAHINAVPFLAKKRLLIVKNLLCLKNKKNIELVQKIINKLPETTVLLFYEAEKFDKKIFLYKILKKEKFFEFKKLSLNDLSNWIKKILTKNNISSKANEEIKNMLIQNSSDMHKIANDIEKIILFLKNSTYNKEQLKKLIKKDLKINIFIFLDAILKNKKNETIYYFEELIKQKENALYIYTMIIYQIRTMIIIKDLIANKYNNNCNKNIILEISQKTKINFYIIQKNIYSLEYFSLDKLIFLYQKLLDYEIKIKKGEITPILAIEIFLNYF